VQIVIINNSKKNMKRIGFSIIAIIMVVFSLTDSYAQIDYGAFSKRTKYKLDTFALEKSGKLAEESKGIQEREVEPDKYIVGPGDEFHIVVMLSIPLDYEAVVSAEGVVVLQEAGSVFVKNKTLAEAKEMIYKQIKKYVKSDDISIALEKIREFKVTVSGAVAKPISVQSSPVDRVSEVIDRAGGFQFDASYRNITLKRQIDDRDTIIIVDIIRYLMLGDKEANPTVLGGDVIVVPPSKEKNAIKIFGDVNIPGEFEFKEGDKLSTLIGFAGGFTKSSFLDTVEIASFDKYGRTISRRSINLTKWRNIKDFTQEIDGDFTLNSGDRLYVRSIPEWNNMKYVIIQGEVKYPGKYAIDEKKDKLSDIFNRAGGITELGSYKDIDFIRQKEAKKKDPEYERLRKIPLSERSLFEQKYFTAKNSDKKGYMAVDIENAIKNPDSRDNIYMRNQDSIIVPQKIDYVVVEGRVVNQGIIKFQKGWTYLKYIEMSGGFAYRADESETFIKKSNGEFFLAEDMETEIEPGDIILVPSEKEMDLMEGITTWVTILAQFATFAGVIVALTK
jgi:protein involved in polysaccharide export with SLBB domain